MDLIVGFALSLLISVAVIPLLMRFAAPLKLVDAPSEDRKIHVRAIPRVGGLGMVIAVALTSLQSSVPGNGLPALYWGGLLIVLFGVADDRYGLSARWKLLGQAAAVIVTMSGGLLIAKIPFMGLEPAPLWLSCLVTFGFIMAAINAVNLSDGLDGLAAGTMLLSLGFIVVGALKLQEQWVAMVALGVMGGLLGFLRYNTHPARVFMGDTGSQFLGYIVACLAVLITQDEGSAMSPALPVLILGLPLLDTLLVICIRLVRGRPVFSADNSHIHHQLLRLGFRHYEVVALLYCIQALFVVMAWQLRFASDGSILAAYGLVCASLVGAIGLALSLGWAIRDPVAEPRGKDRRNHWLRRLGWLHRHAPFSMALGVGLLFVLTALLSIGLPGSLAWGAVLCGLLGVVLNALAFLSREWITRILCYPACVFCGYLIQTYSMAGVLPAGTFDVILLLLAGFLVLSIRVTRRVDFRLDTQDLLILFLIVVLPLLPFDSIERLHLGGFVVRLAVLLYGCEYVIGINRGGQGVLRVSAVASFLLAGVPSLLLLI